MASTTAIALPKLGILIGRSWLRVLGQRPAAPPPEERNELASHDFRVAAEYIGLRAGTTVTPYTASGSLLADAVGTDRGESLTCFATGAAGGGCFLD
jgi:hypothetical protein